METVSYVLEVRETKQHGSEDPPLLMLLTFALGLGADLGPAGEDGGGEAAAGSEFAADDAPFGLHGGDDVAQDFDNGVFEEVGHVIERMIIAGRGQSREKSLGVDRLERGETMFPKRQGICY